MNAVSSGLLRAVTAAAGEALNKVGGLRLTRLVRAASQGDTALCVERSFGLPSPGSIAIDGIPYAYQQANDGSLVGVSYTHGGVRVEGCAASHDVGSQVTDLSGTYSAIDQSTKALFLSTATGADLSVLGRNLGVLRAPSLADDGQYRELIAALAYNPKGTLFGLRLVLDTLVGAGNYALYEDLEAAPCEIFITVPGALFLDNVSQGKAYLEETVTVVPSNNVATTNSPETFISSLRPINENFFTPCAAQPPDVVAPALWALTLSQTTTAQATISTQPAYGQIYGSATQLQQTPGFYRHLGSTTPYTYARLFARVAFSLDGSVSTSDGRCFGARLCDGVRGVAWGVMQQDESQTANIGLISLADGTFVNGAAAQVELETFHDIELRKYASSAYALYLDGVLVQTALYATAAATALFGADIGNINNTISCTAQVLSLGFAAESEFDYLNLRPAAGLTASLSKGSNQLTFNEAVLQATDSGKTLAITRSASTNAYGGNNNGRYSVSYVNSEAAALGLPGGMAQAYSAYPQRLTLSSATALVYPDNLGTQIQISGSTQGNNGTYTILRMYDPYLETSFAASPTTKPRTTNICEVGSASFVTEPGLAYSLLPQFAAESNVRFELIDAATRGVTPGGMLTVAPRAPVTLPNVPLAARAANVRTGQVYSTHVPFVAILKDGSFTASPFYVSDAVFYVEAYIQAVVAAGIRVNFSFS